MSYKLDNQELENLLYTYKPIMCPFISYSKVILDRFGILSDLGNIQQHPLPKHTSMTLYEATEKRAKTMPNAKIMWSGGIDSTYIICCYIKNNIPFTAYCSDSSINDNPLFYKWAIDNGYTIINVNNPWNLYTEKDLITGYCADMLFAPFGKKKIYANLSFDDIDKDVMDKIANYAEVLGKDIDTPRHIARLIDFGCTFFQSEAEMNYILFPDYPINTFFNHADFTDVAYSSFWDADLDDGKPEMKSYILDVTQDEDVTNGTIRNKGNIKPRLELNEDNYRMIRTNILKVINSYEF